MSFDHSRRVSVYESVPQRWVGGNSAIGSRYRLIGMASHAAMTVLYCWTGRPFTELAHRDRLWRLCLTRIRSIAACFCIGLALAHGPASIGQGREISVSQRWDRVVRQELDISCGAAALATILTFQHGDPIGESEVIAGLLRRTTMHQVKKRQGFSLLDLKSFAAERGYAAEGFAGMTNDDLAAVAPAIIPIVRNRMKHFVVFEGFLEKGAVLGDPARGTHSVTLGAFNQLWASREAFVISRRDDRTTPDSANGSTRP